MADHYPSGSLHNYGRLDASGSRDVVYCHQCNHEWYQDQHGLICPRCESEVTEIISPESDPRPDEHPTLPGFPSLQSHNPWGDSDNSDPDEADIEEHITHGPGGSVFIRQTVRSSTPRGGTSGGNRQGAPNQTDPTYVMRDFQNMLGTLMGPGFRAGRPGRSGPDELFPGGAFPATGFRVGGAGGGQGPQIVGGRFTFQSGNLRPRNTDRPQEDGPPVDDLATLIGNIFNQMGATAGDQREGQHEGQGGMPNGLQGLFTTLLNPANARHGDAVYTQEALDQIISTLMEQHPTSNAPGPAPPTAIAALPKRKLDEKLLGPEGKGECSVCMDDVHIGDEVVSLPCKHWFHEACAAAWLGEHNTCPICRKGIDEAPTSERPGAPAAPSVPTEHRPHRLNLGRLSRDTTSSRNETRLDAIRANGRLSPPEETGGSSRRQAPSDISSPRDRDRDQYVPGSYRRRDSEMSVDYQRDSRRGHTSGSDRSRDSRRSSRSGGEGSSGGPISWLRDRFSSNSGNRKHD